MDISELLKKTITNKHINTVALIRRNGKVLMGLREYKQGDPVWTLPGGRCDAGETLEKTLLREVREEIGVNDLKILRLVGRKSGVKLGDKVFFFECATNQEPKLMEPGKFLEWKWISLNNLPSNLIDQSDLKFIKLLL